MTAIAENKDKLKITSKSISTTLDDAILKEAAQAIEAIAITYTGRKDRPSALEFYNTIKNQKPIDTFLQDSYSSTAHTKDTRRLAEALIVLLDILEFQNQKVKIQTWICKDPNKTAKDWRALLNFQKEAERPHRELITTLTHLCKLDPTNSENWLDASRQYYMQNDLDNAKECCLRANQLTPTEFNNTSIKIQALWQEINSKVTTADPMEHPQPASQNTPANLQNTSNETQIFWQQINNKLASVDARLKNIEQRGIGHKRNFLRKIFRTYISNPLASLKNANKINIYLPRWKLSPFNSAKKKSKKKKLLVIFNMETMPYSVGECFYMYQAAFCKYPEAIEDGFDIAFVADITKPARADQGTHKYNYFEKLQDLANTASFLNNVHSNFIFGDRKQFEKFIAANRKKYNFWPNIKDFHDNKLAYQKNVPVINEIFIEKGALPILKPRPILEDRMRKLILDNSSGEFPVCVHLRLNKAHRDSRRNSNISAWQEFFMRCLNEGLNLKFFVICGAKELQEPEIADLKDLNNVFLVKSLNTTSSDDFALTTVAGAFLGGPSGPSVAVMYSDRPYVFFNYKKETSFHFIGTGPGQNYQFALENQELVWKPETADLIYNHFSRIFEKIDKNAYFKELQSPKRTKGSIESIHALR